ncbi:MAG: SprT family zinc-dependent metalloprotease [Patescibacteria group bacterium]
MLKQIKLRDRELSYTLKVSRRARRLRLTVYGDGSCSVTQPRWLPRRFVEAFLRAKADWLLTRLDHFQKFPTPLLGGAGRRSDYRQKKEAARSLVLSRLENFNRSYGFKYGRVSIRNQATRWGSCSRAGNLNFNYRLIDLPPEAADYIIVHELCHLAEFNHSPRFWQLVAKTVPDYDARRRSLRSKLSV